jgi:hypothetical protein
MSRALGLRAARGEPFGGGLSGAAREQPATVGVGPARTVGGVLRGPRGTRTANGRGVRPLGSGTRLEPSSADRPHLGWVYDRAVVMARECRRTSCCSRRPVSRSFSFGLYRARLNSGVNQRKPPPSLATSASRIDCVKLLSCRNDHRV